MANSFDMMVKRIAEDSGWSRLQTAEDFVDAWSSFVDQCFRGYDMNIYEYENDLSVRGMIDLLLNNNYLFRFPEFADFSDRVTETDAEFRALLQEGVEIRDAGSPWWERGVPRMAGDELAKDFSQLFQVAVQRVPGR